MRITEPFHGAVLNRRNGRESAEGLIVAVRGLAEPGREVTVNGAAARRDGEEFRAEVPLREKETEIVAVAAGGAEHRVRVVWDRYSRPRYRFSIDDNIFFLRDIARRGCGGLFDCSYLDSLRGLHERYGAKFVLNLFYRTAEGDFDLSEFPDRYRGEWADNADWLKLAFHAHAEFPDRPYESAEPAELARDFDQVAEQIRRFAGPAAYSPTTIVHFAMLRPEALPVLAERGVTALSTALRTRNGRWDLNCALDDRQCEYLSRHQAVKDFGTGIVFSNCDLICNLTPVEAIAPTLSRVAGNPDTAEVLDLFTHEQYFWEFYPHYLPDHRRVAAAVRWVTQRGYEPVFFHEGLLGGRDWA